MKTKIRIYCLGLMALLLGTAAHAGPMLDFDVSAIGSNINTSGITVCATCSFNASLVPGLGGEIFSLGVGDTYTFDFFAVEAAGFMGNTLGPIGATLAFDTPSAAAPGLGFTFFAFGTIASGGVLTWINQPGEIFTPQGSFIVTLSDINSPASLGLTIDGVVQATVEVTSVPEPGTLALVGLGVLLLGLQRRRSVL